MKNSKQPINPTTYTRVGNNDDDFEPLIDGKKTGYEKKFGGLTKREYFAGLALQGLTANYLRDNVQGWDIKCYAIEAVELADELLKQLEINE